MSSPKPAKLTKKRKENTEKSFADAPTVECDTKHEDGGDADPVALKRSLRSKEKRINSGLKATKKSFVIPRKNQQAKELLQSQNFDSREVKDLLRQLNQYYRLQVSSSKFKFEKVEFVNNSKLRKKYADKKQEMRLELPKNRELEEKLGFVYTTSRSKVKDICEKGLQTGHCNLTFLGDPKLGVYVCRYADVVHKRPLDDKDKGYLIVFNVVKGKNKSIGGGNPEQQPTPHHDCHTSKLFTNLSSSATHGELYGASMFYFYEIDENSEEFHVKQPRQVLPYAVLKLSIAKVEAHLGKSDKIEEKNLDKVSRKNENTVSSPFSEDLNDNVISASNVSWAGQLFFKNNFIAFVNLVTYSAKKLFLPDYIDKINICKKISLDQLKTVFKCPIFLNGKPSSTRVSREFSSGGMFTYYEVQPIHDERERFNRIMTHFTAENTGALIEYIAGVVYMYIVPTSQLTHDAGITDEKSPSILHVLVHVKRICPFPALQDKPVAVESRVPSSSEESVSVWVQEILKEKLKAKPKKKLGPPSLFCKEIIVKQNVEGHKFISVDSSKDQESKAKPERKRKEIGKSVDSKAIVDKSNSWAGHDYLGNRIATSSTTSSTFKNSSRNRGSSSSSRSLGNANEDDNLSTRKGQGSGDMRFEFSKLIPTRQRGESNKGSQDKTVRENLKSYFSLDKDSRVKLEDVQKLIKAFKNDDNTISNDMSSDTLSLMSQDQRLPRRQSPNTNTGRSNESRPRNQGVSKNLLIATPPLPPPLPSTMSPYVNHSPAPCTPDTSNQKTITEALSSVSTLPSTDNDKPGASKSESSSSVWTSPPLVERKSLLIPGLEPPGSPVFDLIKGKQVFSIIKGRKGNINHLSSNYFPTPPQAKETKQMSPIPTISPPPTPLVLNNSLRESGESRSHSTQNRLRPLTAAEQASAEAKEKVISILQQNAHIRTDTEPSPKDGNNKGSDKMKVKSILKTTAKQYEAKKLKPSDEAKKDLIALTDVSPTKNPSLQENKESPIKVVSLNEYRNKAKQNTSLVGKDCEKNVIKTANSQSQDTKELKNGLDLIDKLFPHEKDQDPSVAKSEPPKVLKVQAFTENIKNKVRDCKSLPFEDSRNESSAPKKKRRIVTLKRNSLQQTCGYDDMTSDISDEELPEDKMTSDISDTELPDDYTESDIEAHPCQSGNSKSLTRTNWETREMQGQRRLVSDVTRSTQKKSRSPLQSPSRSTPRSLQRSMSRSISPDDFGRERKRRKTEVEQKGFQKGICDRLLNENDSDSGSNMSISPLNSPVSFEYANDGTYYSIDNIPQGGRVLGGMSTPRSPKEVGRIDSPGTPETAVPATDFLHADVGYWSTGIAVANNAALPYGTLGYLETQVDKNLYEPAKQDNVGRYESGNHGNLSHYDIIGNGDVNHYETANQRDVQPSYFNNPTPSDPYHGDKNLKTNIYSTEEHRVDSRGEGYFVSGGSSIGEGSGYDSPSFNDSRRPFFGTTENLILTAYDKSVNICTDYDYKCMDDCYPPSRLEELRDEGQERCYVSRSPCEDVPSPGSPVRSRAEMPYALDRRIVTVDGYQQYQNTSRSDDEDAGLQQRIDEYGNENGSYCDEGSYFSGQELREYDEDCERAGQIDQQYYDVEEDTIGLCQSNQRTYDSDDENVVGETRSPRGLSYEDDIQQINRYDYDSVVEDYIRDADNYNSADEDYDQSLSSSNRQNYNSRDEDYYRYSSPTNPPNYSSGDEDYSRDSLILTRENYYSEDEEYRREARPLSREKYKSENECYVRDSCQSSRINYNSGNKDYTRNAGKSSRKNYNSGDEDFGWKTRRSSRKSYDLEGSLYARGTRTSIRDNYNSEDDDYDRYSSPRNFTKNVCSDNDGHVQDTRRCQPVRETYNSEDEDYVKSRRQSNRDHCKSGSEDHAWRSRRDTKSKGIGRAPDTSQFRRGHFKSNSKDNAGASPANQSNYNSEDEVNERSNHRDTSSTRENVNSGQVSSDSKDLDHEYLDDIAKENIDKTTLNFDKIVCEGLRNFPSQLLNFLQTHCDPKDSVGLSNSSDSSSQVQRGKQCLNDKQKEITGASNANKDNASISVVSTSRDPRLNRRLHDSDSGGADTTDLNPVEPNVKDASENKIDQPNTQITSRVQSYFYVYEPENDNECKAVRNYMLKTGARYFDVRNFDADKLKAVKGGIRILIRGKHKSALHKINNLSKLKCLRNVKFALFNTVEDVAKKTRAYTAIFQYGGVLIPDDFILKRIHPAYLEALLRFMAEENEIHQKVFWVMNIRYQAYKKLGSQRPLTRRDTFALELLRKYRNEGFVNIIQKDYVTEGLSLIQRYLDTAWRQQRDLMATYRHFIMLSNMERQKSEASWFRNRGIGFMDIKTFLLGFAGDRKTKELLFSSRFSGGGNVPTTSPNKNSTEDIEDHNRGIDTLAHKPSGSTIASRIANSDTDENIKERRLEILTSIKNKVNLLNNNKESSNVQSPSENIASSTENNEITSSSNEIVSFDIVSKGTSIKPEGSNQETSSGRDNSLKETTNKDAGSTPIGKTLNHSPCKSSTRQLTQNSGSPAKGTSKEVYKHSRTGSPTEVFRSRVCSLKGISRACSPKKATRKRVDSPKDNNVDMGSQKESSLKNPESPPTDLRSNKEINLGETGSSRGGITKETNGKDECRKETKGSTNEKYFSDHSRENKERQEQTSKATTWSRTVRSVVNESFSSRRGSTKRGNSHPRHFVSYGKRRFVQERTVNRQ